jgi:enamine deaminase RidA (YjgF/YER057c/UK114 family)
MGLEIKKYPIYSAGRKQRCSKSVVVGNLVFCTGMDGASPETGKMASDSSAGQTTAALDKVRETLREAGTTTDNIVRTVIFLKDMRDYEAIREAELKYYQQHAPFLVNEPPASKVIQYCAHTRPEALVEIGATAVLSRGRPGWEV